MDNFTLVLIALLLLVNIAINFRKLMVLDDIKNDTACIKNELVEARWDRLIFMNRIKVKVQKKERSHE